jgi:hypothetical protein
VTTLCEIEKSALELPEAQRARLAAHLLQSLSPGLDEKDEGIAEAVRRDAELGADPSQDMDLEEFDAQLRQRRSRGGAGFIAKSA